MADETDVLDMLFDSNHGILGGQSSSDKGNSNMLFSLSEKSTGGDFDFDSDWSSSLLTNSLEGINENEFFNALMETNLPDDVKEQQQHQPQQKQFTDHAYSISPTSPHSDSGMSSGPYSPSNSSNSIEDIERELFAPLDLKSYESSDDTAITIDPMLLDSISNCSSSPGLYGSESPVNFDFDSMLDQSSTDQVKGITISTDETTKAIKVISVVNSGSGNRQQSLLSALSGKAQTHTGSQYPELRLSDEEKDLLRKEGISMPSHLPLTREEEKILRSVRRRIRNKASARNSRRKKQDYMEALEQRVKNCTDEKRQLEKKVNALEKQNSTLIGQLKKLQKMVTEGTRHTAKTGTCAMILALSFALVLLPNYQSLTGSNSSEDTLMKPSSDVSGRPSRSLLSKPEDYINVVPQQDKSFSYVPFVNFEKPATQVSTPRKMVDEPIDGEILYMHDPIDEEVDIIGLETKSSVLDMGEKVIHMEITKLPEEGAMPATGGVENETEKTYIHTENIVRHRNIRMDIDDEL